MPRYFPQHSSDGQVNAHRFFIIPLLSLLCTIVFISLTAHSQALFPEHRAILSAMLENPATLARYVDEEELRISQRLEITYEGVTNKFLIGYELDNETINALRKKSADVTVCSEALSDSFSLLHIRMPSRQIHKAFYCYRDKLVSPVRYVTRRWHTTESDYVVFVSSDSTLFHREAIETLEQFIVQTASLLGISEQQLRLLQQEKVRYYYCKNEDEIELLTGYRSRGMVVLAYDYIISTYPCHLHELTHLLTNFALQHLPLYTHPLLQEGIAVGLGGRGGIAQSTLMQTGIFLAKSGFLDYKELLDKSAFTKSDPSLTYPLSGLYTMFLVQKQGMKSFLSLYKKYSVKEGADVIRIPEEELPPHSAWEQFLDSLGSRKTIYFQPRSSASTTPILSNADVRIEDAGSAYLIAMKRNFGLRPALRDTNYHSTRYAEVISGQSYSGEHFVFTADSTEITIYDMYINSSVASYTIGLTIDAQAVPLNNGMLNFYVDKSVFHTSLTGMELIDEAEKR